MPRGEPSGTRRGRRRLAMMPSASAFPHMVHDKVRVKVRRLMGNAHSGWSWSRSQSSRPVVNDGVWQRTSPSPILESWHRLGDS